SKGIVRPGAWLKERAPAVHRFLTRRDRPWPLVRELLYGVLVILLLVTLLYGLTAQPLNGGYPVVVVTSGSMMHCTDGPTLHPLGKDCNPTVYGRIGTIAPGDLVFVRHVDDHNDVDTKAMGDAASEHYGGRGDVIVYRPNGSLVGTPIIHR